MILCCGEALIDMVPAPLAKGSLGFTAHCGGSVFNTALGLGRLGADVAFLSAISEDAFGQQLLGTLKESGVGTEPVTVTSLPSPLAFAHLDADGQASYHFYSQGCADEALSQDHIVALLASMEDLVDVAFFGGISLVRSPGADIYLEAWERLAEHAVLMLDPNIRPSYILEEQAYRDRLMPMLAMADIVKLSSEDLDWLMPDQMGYHNQLYALRAHCSGLVIVTHGAMGAYLYGPDQLEIYAPSPQIDVIDSIGAGDSFNAAFLASLQTQGLLKKTCFVSDVGGG